MTSPLTLIRSRLHQTGASQAEHDALEALVVERDELVTALEPFAAFRAVQKSLGGTYPQTGPFQSVVSRGVEAELTIEHLEAATTALSKHKLAE